MRTVTWRQFEQICDDPSRDEPGNRNVRAVLVLHPDVGFELWAEDAHAAYRVTDDGGVLLRFRTIEEALRVVTSLAGLDPEIGLFVAENPGGPGARKSKVA